MRALNFIIIFLLIHLQTFSQNQTSSKHDISSVMTTVFSLVNVPLTIINIQKMASHNTQIKSSVVGIVTGVFQSAYGAYQINEAYSQTAFLTDPNKLRTLGRVNLGIGLTTILVGGLNIVLNKKPSRKSSAQIYSIQDKWVIAYSWKKSI